MNLQPLPRLQHESPGAFEHRWSQELASCPSSLTGTELTG